MPNLFLVATGLEVKTMLDIKHGQPSASIRCKKKVGLETRTLEEVGFQDCICTNPSNITAVHLCVMQRASKPRIFFCFEMAK